MNPALHEDGRARVDETLWPVHSRVRTFTRMSSMTVAGSLPIRSARRARQTRLLTWSASTAPVTDKPGGMITSSRNFIVDVLRRHAGQQPVELVADLTRNYICGNNHHHSFPLLKKKGGSGLQAVTAPESGRQDDGSALPHDPRERTRRRRGRVDRLDVDDPAGWDNLSPVVSEAVLANWSHACVLGILLEDRLTAFGLASLHQARLRKPPTSTGFRHRDIRLRKSEFQ